MSCRFTKHAAWPAVLAMLGVALVVGCVPPREPSTPSTTTIPSDPAPDTWSDEAPDAPEDEFLEPSDDALSDMTAPPSEPEPAAPAAPPRVAAIPDAPEPTPSAPKASEPDTPGPEMLQAKPPKPKLPPKAPPKKPPKPPKPPKPDPSASQLDSAASDGPEAKPPMTPTPGESKPESRDVTAVETSAPVPSSAPPSTPEAPSPLKKSELLVVLPPESCNTPDAMALLPDGNIVVSVPNFNDTEQPPLMMKITPDNKAEKFLDLPPNPDTGQPFGALGVCVAPSGDLLIADYQMEGPQKSRVCRIKMKDGVPGEVVPEILGFNVSNAVICRDGYVYVTDTQIDAEAKPSTSGVFRFKLEELEGEPIQLGTPLTEDPHFIALIHCFNEELPLGADGLCFDKAGNLYIGNFSDGTVHRL